MAEPRIPTLYEWLGGIERLKALTTIFYRKVLADAMLGPLFEHMRGDHPERVALFLGEVMGGPSAYSETYGGHPRMISQHLNRMLTEPQRRRWIELLVDSADEAGLPSDPEFRSAFVAYIEWGTRMAVLNSQAGSAPAMDGPMPRWGWGEAKSPYRS